MDSLIDLITGLTDPVYRFYNPSHQTHFFTISPIERDSLIKNPQMGYQYEGECFKASIEQKEGLDPVYRFYHSTYQTHVLTIDEGEYQNLLLNKNLGYEYEGIAFYAFQRNSNIAFKVYRFYNSLSKSHFFTINEEEKDNIIIHPHWGYKYEDIAFEANML